MAIPDHLRCRRTDGRQWRCRRRRIGKIKFCELHHLQAQHRQAKIKVPDSLKIHRKPRRASKPSDRPPKSSKPNPRLPMDLIRIATRWQIEKWQRKKAEEVEVVAEAEAEAEEVDVEAEVTWHLPNGVMAILPAPIISVGKVGFGSVSFLRGCFRSKNVNLERKVGFSSGSFLRRCFRSKNVELLSVGRCFRSKNVEVLSVESCKKFLCGNNVGVGRGGKRICHRCRESKMGCMIRCSSCREFFCSLCIKKWYSEMSELEVKEACPICCGNCSCKTCMYSGHKNGFYKYSA